MKKAIFSLLTFLLPLSGFAQSTVTANWPFDANLKGMDTSSDEYATATAAVISCEGTDLSSKFNTTFTAGSGLVWKAVMTPASSETGETGLKMVRFGVGGTTDNSDTYAVTFDIQAQDGFAFAPTGVKASLAIWTSGAGNHIDLLMRKVNSDGITTAEYTLGSYYDDVPKAEYTYVNYDMPQTVTASTDKWQLVIRMGAGYATNNQFAIGDISIFGTGTVSEDITTYFFSVAVSPEGAGTVSPASTKVVAGDAITVSATANIGYGFSGWYNGETQLSSTNPYTVSDIASDMSLTALFDKLPEALLTYGVAQGSEGMGSVSVSETGSGSEGAYTYNSGTSVKLTAKPVTGHVFVNWIDAEGNVLSTASSYTVKVDGDKTVYAVFRMIENYKADLIAFPGAEGWGKYTTGGRMIDSRGAKVYYVTRNDDCDGNNLVEGTLRWALLSGDDTPRTVLFNTCGTIYLTSKLSVKANTSIIGQTAPGGGVCIAGYPLKITNPNVIVRHIRFREGDLPTASMTALDVENTHHVILDHCSMTWSMEENLTLYDCDSTTIQWSILSEGLYSSKNVKGSRAYATQWGGEHGTMHHCLISNCNSRTPRFNGVRTESSASGGHDRYVDNEFINNVVFNWGKQNSVYGGECYKHLNGGDNYNRVYMINNYFRPGPCTKGTKRRFFVGASGYDGGEGMGQWYLKGNKFETGSKYAGTSTAWTDASLTRVNADNFYGFTTGSEERAFDAHDGNTQAVYDKIVLSAPVLSSNVETETADEAFVSVTSKAGASLPRYDEEDTRLLAEAYGTVEPKFYGTDDAGNISRAAGIINTPADIEFTETDSFVALDEATGQLITTDMWPFLGMRDGECRVTDTDGDGMPDAYETSVGLNPNDAADGYQLTGSGYSNLEIFLNGVADGTIDMSLYTTREEVEKQIGFNAIVDPAAETESPNTTPAIFKTVTAAVEQAQEKASATSPYYIFIKAGTYNEHIEITKSYIHLMGQNCENTIITDNRPASEYANIEKSVTLYIKGSDITLDNLTVSNTYGAGSQALALYTLGDRITVTRCNLYGYQDTYRTGKASHRHLVRRSTISGTTDFIYNGGDVFFDTDTLKLVRATNVITAPKCTSPTWGYVFRDAFITTDLSSASTHLGRPWGETPKVSFINTRLDDNVTIKAEGWYDMGGLPVQMAEYNTTDAAGNAVDLSSRRTTFTVNGTSCTSKAVLDMLEASAYTVDNVLRGTDNWDADYQGMILPAPEMTVGEGTVSWSDPTGLAMCYLLVKNGEATLTTSTSCDYAEGDRLSVQLVSENAVLGEVNTPEIALGVRQILSEGAILESVYSVGGQRLNGLRQGVNIVVERCADGQRRVKKTVIR